MEKKGITAVRDLNTQSHLAIHVMYTHMRGMSPEKRCCHVRGIPKELTSDEIQNALGNPADF